MRIKYLLSSPSAAQRSRRIFKCLINRSPSAAQRSRGVFSLRFQPSTSLENLSKVLLIFFTAFLQISCASNRPILDKNNEKFIEAGELQSRKDIQFCKEEAEEFYDQYKAELAAREAAIKALTAGAVGAATGAVWGKSVKSAMIGAAIGATANSAIAGISAKRESKIKPDEIKRRYVADCLAKKGYLVIGWK